MPYSITDFSHGSYAYTNDGGQAKFVSMRNVYAAVSTLTNNPAAGAGQILSKHARRRYIHSATGGHNPSNPVERHFPVPITRSLTPAVQTNLGATIDGITDFVWKGYRGEQDRA